ncbi:YesL family protein [Aquibacillus rhizosphaerae]|uniref:DUF624 domain-containing protein n=1 Tax=Aquibacillus rhizosphaerae TaxID=3051431 RepID=A0ABT7L8W3_9BACI|nr:DUF624 domain-containing protein [Aquibacillus sp. LR5S19]MDL4842304.1 DUF624 domain-containing protein [Aquibacillus sp. LR5S19]
MFTTTGVFGGFYRFGEIVLLLLYVNALWVGFTAMGLVLFGFGPSTVAMFTVFREWSMGKSDVPVFTTFWNTFRKEFFKANGLGILIIAIAYMLYINFNYLEFQGEWLSFISRYFLFVATIIYGIMLIFIFPVYVHYENKFFIHFRNAIFIAIYQPIRTIYAIAACFTISYLFYIFPVLIFLLGASLTSFVLMWISYRTFLRIEYTQEKLKAEQI